MAEKKTGHKVKKILIDVRTPQEIQQFGQHPGSHHYQCDISSDVKECVNKAIKNGVLPEDPKGAPPIVVYCRSGRRAKRVETELKARGYVTTYFLTI
mmetsp:Transcript_32039/g.56258  ORF Transcript_32039/g.56258 Transcript_32039/m.56258 type:complete len:97 (-) Transcript_32039:315-605(-)